MSALIELFMVHISLIFLKWNLERIGGDNNIYSENGNIYILEKLSIKAI